MKIKSIMQRVAALMVISMIFISCSKQERIGTDIKNTALLDNSLLIEQISNEPVNDKTQELEDEITGLKSQINVLNEDISKLKSNIHKNMSYEMFYGEWEATNHIYVDPVPVRGINYDQNMLRERAESIYEGIRETRIQFTQENVIINGNEMVDNITYKFTIFPADDNYALHFTMTLKDIGLIEAESNYYVFVEVESKELQSFWGSNFFIKDQNTLIMLGDGYCVEYTRISYDGGSEEAVIITG